jgi:hypothetical protein
MLEQIFWLIQIFVYVFVMDLRSEELGTGLEQFNAFTFIVLKFNIGYFVF